MIGISYQQPTPKYDAYIQKIQSRTAEDLNRFMKGRDATDRTECVRFINKYLTGNGFIQMMETPAADLWTLIADVERNFQELQDCRIDKNLRNASPLYQFLKYLFVEHGYKNGFIENKNPYSLPKDELIESVGIDVCPYCNRTFIYTTKTVQGNKVTQAELDHFFSKERFPYLAIAKYNLVPSCSCCNRNGGKFTTDVYDAHLVNPYEITRPGDYLKFRLKVKNANVTSLEKLASGLSIKVMAKRPDMQKTIDSLNLEGLYQHHTDYAAELYFKWKVKATHVYRGSVKGLLRKQGITLSDDDIKRIIVGNYVKEADFGKRPLAMMIHDLATEMGLI